MAFSNHIPDEDRDALYAAGEAARADAEASPACPECAGRTITFRGKGLETEWKICPRCQEPGHKTLAECQAEIRKLQRDIRPSGRFA